jgi:hypothetical protein
LLTQQIADLAALARLGRTNQPAMQEALQETAATTPAESAADQPAGPLAQTA